MNQSSQPDPAEFGSEHTPYDAMGGEAPVRALAHTFYERMDANPAYAALRGLHAPDLEPMQETFFEFLSGWLGGPQLYVQKHGHPRLRMRHASFPIDETMRDQWLPCMAEAMDQQGIDGDIRLFPDARLAHVANFMRNTD